VIRSDTLYNPDAINPNAIDPDIIQKSGGDINVAKKMQIERNFTDNLTYMLERLTENMDKDDKMKFIKQAFNPTTSSKNGKRAISTLYAMTIALSAVSGREYETDNKGNIDPKKYKFVVDDSIAQFLQAVATSKSPKNFLNLMSQDDTTDSQVKAVIDSIKINGKRNVMGDKETAYIIGIIKASKAIKKSLENYQLDTANIENNKRVAYLDKGKIKFSNNEYVADIDDKDRVGGVALPMEILHNSKLVNYDGMEILKGGFGGTLGRNLNLSDLTDSTIDKRTEIDRHIPFEYGSMYKMSAF